MPNARANPFVWLLTQVRSVVGFLFAVFCTFLASIVVMVSAFAGSKNLTTSFMRTWGVLVLWVFGIRVEASGEENLPERGGGIVVFNHQSLFDIPVLMQTTRKHLRFGAKIELFKIPFFGRAMRAAGTLPIARESRSEVMRIYKEAEKNFEKDFLFVLAPEGTRQRDPVLGRYKKGPFIFAINAGVPVIPAVIKGTHYVLPKNSLNVNVGRLSRTIYVEFLPAVSTKGLSLQAIDQIVDGVRTAMVEKFLSLPSEV
jgi:1-acyl-sn-glycerol-3-phosphate acyltransferase